MSLTNEQKLELQQRFAAATASGQPEHAAVLCADGAEVWHNYDEESIPYVDTGKSLVWLHRKVPDIAWETRKVTATADGWMWQAAITGTAPGGPLRAQTCMIATLNDDGLIVQLDEYIDPVQMLPVRAK
jgi:ketosteroid isomerase-like protein